MKLAAIFVTVSLSLALTSNISAGPAVSSAPAQPESGIIASGSQLPSGVSPGLNANNSVASQSGGPTQTGAATTSGTSGVSSAGPNTSQSRYATGLSSGTSANAPTAVDLKKEKVVEVSVNDLAAERSKNHETTEVAKKFESSLLNADVASIDQIKKQNEGNSQSAPNKDGGASASRANVVAATKPEN